MVNSIWTEQMLDGRIRQIAWNITLHCLQGHYILIQTYLKNSNEDPNNHILATERRKSIISTWWRHSRCWPFVRRIHRHWWILHTKASDAGLWWVFFYLCRNKRLSKQWRGWWFETLSCPLCSHYDVTVMRHQYGPNSLNRQCNWMCSSEMFCFTSQTGW